MSRGCRSTQCLPLVRPSTDVRDRTLRLYYLQIINAAKYMNSVILTVVSFSNTRYSLLLHQLALDGSINNEFVILQGPLEFLSKVPMNCFHGSILFKGIAT